jgi:4-amino-4-deoxy-L-arabinose transferase-like glycosyltransferase
VKKVDFAYFYALAHDQRYIQQKAVGQIRDALPRRRGLTTHQYGLQSRLLASPAVNLSRPVLALLAAIFLAAWLIPSATRTLVRPDEGRYAEIAREMALAGDYVTPRLNGLKYFEKPPLQYWATALAFATFGQSELTARWWPAFTGLLGIVLVGLAMRALTRRGDTALVTAVVLAAMCYYFLIAHINTLDMGLTAFMTLTLVGLLRGFGVRGQSERAARGWMVAAWAGAALAFLSKGLIGIVLPGTIFVIYLLITRQWRLLGKLEWIWGPLVFVLIAAPWPLLVQARNPEWANFFFIYEHFERFASSEHDRLGSIHYFVPIVIAGLLPWTPALIKLLHRQSWQDLKSAYAASALNVPLLLSIWCVFMFVFFSVSQSKLPSYLLPITPAAAMLLAPVMLAASQRSFRWLLAMMATIPLALIALAVVRRNFVSDAYTEGMVDAFALYVTTGALCFAAAIASAWWLDRKQRRIDAMIMVAVLSVAAGSITASGYETLSASTSSKALVQDFLSAEPQYHGADAFYSVGLYEQTLPPYLKRTVTLVDYLDEMGLGAALEPDLVRFNFSDFAEEWLASERAYAITDFDQLPRMDMAGLDYRVVAADLRRVIIARHAQ